MITSDPKTILLALLGGIIPALLWLWFWLKEDNQKPEPKGLVTLLFLLGMACVIFVIPIQKLIQDIVPAGVWQVIGWASAEELIKLIAVMLILYKTNRIDEPVDWPIFLITLALGFAALENAMFLLKPLSVNDATVSLLTGQLRFLGSTLLHAVSSGTIGIALGLSFFMSKHLKRVYLIIGILFAITLHSAFNFFIIKDNGSNSLEVLGFLWVVTIIIMLIFEKLRRMSEKK